jgi:4-alpha-glucanotransferase
MIAQLHIHYKTQLGEQVNVILKRENTFEIIHCQTFNGENWTAAIEVVPHSIVQYKYQVVTHHETIEEWGDFRTIQLTDIQTQQLFIQDSWRTQADESNTYFSAAFKDVIFRRSTTSAAEDSTPKKEDSSKGNAITFQLNSAAIPSHLRFCIIGNTQALGSWEKPLLMSDAHYPLWQVTVENLSVDFQAEYKYAIYDEDTKAILAWENGDNRTRFFTFPQDNGSHLIITDEHFRYPFGRWRGAGMAIPVFSLRSYQGLGIGEFNDLKLAIDWACATGMKLVQVLPVNDTIASKTWIDSYPYAAISVFALHPLYVNIQAIAPLKDKKLQKELDVAILTLNEKDTVDFEAVLRYKFKFFKALYQQEKTKFWADQTTLDFIEQNKDWLQPYAAFCYLRDQNATSNFNEWNTHQTFSDKTLEEINDPKAKHFDEVALYYFIQFHAHQQLFGATAYARQQGVVLKGDLPIGIYRYSCDAWVAPQLYNMDGQAGAPPDDFAVAGQNWGFPTYNWEVMAQDNFAWWRQRMTKLSEYFDALRIDHILGFFRIWQIPIEQVEGTMGLFNPRLPYTIEDLRKMGLQGDLNRYTKPYIRTHYLAERFGKDAEWVKATFLTEIAQGIFLPKKDCDTQLKIKNLFQTQKEFADKKHLEKAIYSLISEVLLLEEPNSNGQAFNPRITLFRTRSFQDLSDYDKAAIQNIYNDYYFVRHDEFWKKQALWKLPALLKATNMLICGEDLGMIPNSVPGVMKALNIISLEIQRMPKGAATFGETWNYPYLSVCSPSCHDMSTIRGWWESDYATAQRFYNENLHWYGSAPPQCSTELVEAIVNQHLQSPSMWAIFPIQDLVGIDSQLRRADAAAEQINEPSNPQHYWRFRFHIPMEDLLNQVSFSERILNMVKRAGR